MASTYAPFYPYQAWPSQNQSFEQYDTARETGLERELNFSPGVSPRMQPMQRYIQETDRLFLTSHSSYQDGSMHSQPGVLANGMHYAESEASLYSMPPRFSSPTDSGLSSDHVNGQYDHESTPWTSPSIRHASFSPEAMVPDFGGCRAPGAYHAHNMEPCVALHDVQGYADAQPETVPYEEDLSTAYGSMAQEGYQPIHEEGIQVGHYLPSQPDDDEDTIHVSHHDIPPVIRKRRANSTRTITSPIMTGRVAKRPINRRTSSLHSTRKSSIDEDGHVIRAFPCPFTIYGCTSTFGSKNEWKRHVTTQHMRLGFWRCDQCPNSERKPNDFNRKDLFTQHVRRMHPVALDDRKPASKSSRRRSQNNKNEAEEEALRRISRRCYKTLRAPPQKSGCLFCDAQFSGPNTWEERMEHIGRHMENSKKSENGPTDPNDWEIDEHTEDWLISEGLVVRQKSGGLILAP
jgi:hypothetical protein